MAITDIAAFAHLTDADIENLAVELDAIRLDIEDSRGERDARYIRRTIAAQRALDAAGRLILAGSSKRSAWWRDRWLWSGQDHREYGDRPQCHARPVDPVERSGDPLLDMGVGPESGIKTLAVHSQLPAPPIHQHSRHDDDVGYTILRDP